MSAPSTSPRTQTTSLPASAASAPRLADNAFVLPATTQLQALLTLIRDERTQRGDFVFYSDRIIRLLVEEGLNHLPVVSKTIKTPVGLDYEGVAFEGRICGVSIMRGLTRSRWRLACATAAARCGSERSILIQRDEETALPKLFYAKLPDDIADRFCLLLDPMLATGGSCIKAIETLLSHGVQEEKILFLNLIASPEGIKNVCGRFPKLRLITAWVDEGLDDKAYIIPGLGDFGDRYFL
ncbi:Uracil phosphoribosyltransferase, synthesizes UMP from uracil [Cryptotrichosporon argae]